MNIERHVFEPSTVASLSGVAVDAQRDWRHKGHIEGFGSQTESGRWKYSFRDAVAFWAAARLIACGWDRGLAAQNAWEVAPDIIGFVQGKAPKNRFVAFAIKGTPQPGGASELYRHPLQSLDQLAGLEFERLDLIDVQALAAAVPVGIREFAIDVEDI